VVKTFYSSFTQVLSRAIQLIFPLVLWIISQKKCLFPWLPASSLSNSFGCPTWFRRRLRLSQGYPCLISAQSPLPQRSRLKWVLLTIQRHLHVINRLIKAQQFCLFRQDAPATAHHRRIFSASIAIEYLTLIPSLLTFVCQRGNLFPPFSLMMESLCCILVSYIFCLASHLFSGL